MTNKKELDYYDKLWELSQQRQLAVELPQSRTDIENAKKDWISRKMTEDEILSRTGGLDVVVPNNNKNAIAMCVGHTFQRAHQEGCVIERFGFAFSTADVVFTQVAQDTVARIWTLGNGAVNGCDKLKVAQVESELKQIDEVAHLLQVFLDGGASRDEVIDWSKRFLESNGQTYLFDEKVARTIEEIDNDWANDRKELRKMRVQRSNSLNMLAEFFNDSLRQKNNDKEGVIIERMKTRTRKIWSMLENFSPDEVVPEIIYKIKDAFGVPTVQDEGDPTLFIIGENCLVDKVETTKWLEEFGKTIKLRMGVKSDISLREMFLSRVSEIDRIFLRGAIEDWRKASHLVEGIDEEIDNTLGKIYMSTGDELFTHEKRVCELIFKIANQTEKNVGQYVE
jgi:hypothetical protein